MEEFHKENLSKPKNSMTLQENMSNSSLKSNNFVARHQNADNFCNGHHVCFLPLIENGTKINVENGKLESYHCGVCSLTFSTICCLHNHLTTFHLLSGSYHYDYFIHTAFPKHESLCQYTQTDDLDYDREGVFDISDHTKSYCSGNNVKGKHNVKSAKKFKVKSNHFHETKHSEKAFAGADFVKAIQKGVEAETEGNMQSNDIENAGYNDGYLTDRTDDYFENEKNKISDNEIETEIDKETSYRGSSKSEEIDKKMNGNRKKKISKIKRKSKTDDINGKKLVRKGELKVLGKRKRSKVIPDTPDKMSKGATDISGKHSRHKYCMKYKIENNKVLVKHENQDMLDESDNNVSLKDCLSGLPESTESKHVNNQHGKQSVTKNNSKRDDNKCEICGAKFTVKQGLLRHEQLKHADLLNFNCEQCDKKFMRIFNLQKHIIRAHGGRKGNGNRSTIEQDGEKILKCKVELDTCTSFEATPDLPSSTVDKEGIEFEVMNEESELKTARRKRRTNEEMKSMKTPHTCELCGHTMPRSKMDVHKRLHTGERPFICTVCGKGLISQNKLSRHMLIHGEVKRHTCEICGVGFHMKYKLRMHMHIHTGKKPYLCSICGAEFNHSANLATHTRCVHLQVKPYVCNVCGGKYSKRSQLDDHVLSHSTERQFTCRYCGKSFKYFKGMRRHEKSHNEEESFTCDQCGLKFARKENLDRHKISHGESKYQCKTCKKVLKDGRALQEHEFTHLVAKGCRCLVCGEMFYSSSKYFTHLFVAHSIQKQEAQLMIIDEKLKKDNKQIKNDQKVTLTSSVGSGSPVNGQEVPFDVSVAGILESAGKDTMSLLTRVATENLRLHSQDVHEQEKGNIIIPLQNPMIVYEKNRITSLDNTIGSKAGFSLEPKVIGSTVAEALTFPDHAYGQSVKPVDNHVNHSSTVTMSQTVNSIQHQGLNENVLGFVTSNALTSINNLTSYIGQRHSTLTPLTNLSTSLHQDEHGAIESLRQLQDNSAVPIMLVPSTVDMDISIGQQNGVMTSTGSNEGSSQSNYGIQNIY